MTVERISVIVITWNSERFLPDCIDSLAAQTLQPADLIFVDNGSTDRSVEIVRQRAPQAKILEMGENTGFCGANNAGLAEAEGDGVLFLNSDMTLDPGYLEAAARPFAGDERIGSVSGRLVRPDRQTLDSAGQSIARSRRVVERGYGRPEGREFNEAGYVFSVCGASALYRRSTIEDISVDGKFFDPDYFAFSEDLDAGWRARNAGWRAWYEPNALAFHYRSGTAAPPGWLSSRAAILRRSPELRVHILKNRWLTLLKNDRLVHVLRDLPFVAGRDIALAGIALASGPAVVIGLVRSLALCGRALRRRREFLSKRGIWGARRAGLPGGWTGTGLIEEEP